MSRDDERAHERTQLLHQVASGRRLSQIQQDVEAASIVHSHVSKDEAALGS